MPSNQDEPATSPASGAAAGEVVETSRGPVEFARIGEPPYSSPALSLTTPRKWSTLRASAELLPGTAEHFLLRVVHMSNERVVAIEVQRLKEGCFLATSPDIPGMVVEADTVEILILEICSVAGTMLEMTEPDALLQRIVYDLQEVGNAAAGALQPRVVAPASMFAAA